MPERNLLSRLPSWLSHWLGYRAKTPPVTPVYIVWFWSFIGAFCGLSIIQAILIHGHPFIARHVPILIASYGASAVLCYGAIELPLAQPRALVGGHFISALIGVCVTQLFLLLPPEQYESLRWLNASLAASIAIVVMQITKTTHPPAGATALLPAIDVDIRALSWYYLPVCLMSSALVLVTALLLNNIQRRYPTYWIAPPPPPKAPAAPAVPPAIPAGITLEPQDVDDDVHDDFDDDDDNKEKV